MSDVPKFEPDESGYIYQQIADHVERRIKAGELADGARLPAERDLAAEYGVALNTARRATEELRERGLVKTTLYKGSFITAPRNP